MKKRELKKVIPYCYKRVFDLRMYSAELLKCFGLEQGQYFYIGSSNIEPKERTSRWKTHVKDEYSIDKNTLDFMVKYKTFLQETSDMNDKEINESLYETLEIISHHNSIKNAKKFESDLTGHYLMLQEINHTQSVKDRVFMLNSHGASAKVVDGEVRFKRKLFID